jgi:hypothetical protein
MEKLQEQYIKQKEIERKGKQKLRKNIKRRKQHEKGFTLTRDRKRKKEREK